MKLLRIAAVTIATTAAGLLVWRKVEADRLENDLWSAAEKADVPAPSHTAETRTTSSTR